MLRAALLLLAAGSCGAVNIQTSINTHRRGCEDVANITQEGSNCKLFHMVEENGDEVLSAILAALPAHPNLDQIELEGCGVTDEGAATFASIILRQPGLRKANLFNNSITGVGAAAIAQALAATDTNGNPLSSLFRLSLWANYVTDQGVDAFGETFATNSRLSWLLLGGGLRANYHYFFVLTSLTTHCNTITHPPPPSPL